MFECYIIATEPAQQSQACRGAFLSSLFILQGSLKVLKTKDFFSETDTTPSVCCYVYCWCTQKLVRAGLKSKVIKLQDALKQLD